MSTPAEKKALLFLAAVAFLGVSVRALRAVGAVESVPKASVQALDRQLAAVDSARAVRKARGTGRKKGGGSKPRAGRDSVAGGRSTAAPRRRAVTAKKPKTQSDVGAPQSSASLDMGAPQPSGPLDLDVANAEQIESLPGIGPVLARRIVADRDARGPFGSIPNLRRVSGIGPALAEKLVPVVTFSGTPRPLSAAPPESSAAKRRGRPRRRPGT